MSAQTALPRPAYNPQLLDVVLKNLNGELDRRLHKHGPGIYASSHETLGIVTEEYLELIEAAKANNHADFRAELFDLAVAALFGVVSSAQADGVYPE